MLSLNMSRVVDDTHCNRVMQISPSKYIIKNKLIRFDETKISESCTVEHPWCGVRTRNIWILWFEGEEIALLNVPTSVVVCKIFNYLTIYIYFYIESKLCSIRGAMLFKISSFRCIPSWKMQSSGTNDSDYLRRIFGTPQTIMRGC